jgi:hypothetical protein
VAREFLEVDPRILRLPPTRLQGADPQKLQRQMARYGKSINGMPSLCVNRGRDSELEIVDGVTRATRVAKLLPGQTITVEVIHDKPNRDYSKLPRVGERLP